MSVDAEGNGDSISAAVQAERIALLTSVLSHTELSSPPITQPNVRSQSMTPPQAYRAFIDVSPPQSRGPVHRSQSHFDLGSQYANNRPIYQTSGHRLPSPEYVQHSHFTQHPQPHPRDQLKVHAPAPHLPSFLQDLVQSPTLSPSSTSSADLSFEESSPSSSAHLPFSQRGNTYTNPDSCPSSQCNIWSLDGEESKSLSAFPVRNRP